MIVTVDTGGTKTLVATFDRDGSEVAEQKFPTPKDPAIYLETVASAIRLITSGDHIDAISMALPGMIQHGVALWCQNLGWRNVAVREALAQSFPDTPILVDNDANLAGLGETRQLEDIPATSLYLTISTGIGSGVITNGHINPALAHSEAGHCLLHHADELKTWESFGAGSAIVRDYDKMASDITDEATWRDIVETRIAPGLLAHLPLLQPDIVIIGGSVGSYFERFGQLLETYIDSKLPTDLPRPTIIQAKHPEEAVVYGCYYAAIDFLN